MLRKLISYRVNNGTRWDGVGIFSRTDKISKDILPNKVFIDKILKMDKRFKNNKLIDIKIFE